MALSEAQVVALAPDASSVDAARRHARLSAWQGVGKDERALWGVVHGRGPYEVRADLRDLATKCSCPSRKLPCKHALGLLLVYAAEEPRIPHASPPEWVREWLDRRDQRQARAAERGSGAAPVDTAARDKRAAERERRMELGVEGLERWLEDVARTGLASLSTDGVAACEAQAARLTDAQAGGLASRVRRVGALIGAVADWPERTAHDLGRLALLARAWKRRAALDPPLAGEVGQLVGLNTTEAAARAAGARVRDTWWVVGERVEEDERLKSARTWLWGEASGARALVLQFALPTAQFEERFAVGTRFGAELCFYPAALPRRALVVERLGEPSPIGQRWRGHATLDALLDELGGLYATQPWLDRTLSLLEAVVPVLSGERLWACDARGRALPIALRDPWPLLALSGGHPLALAAEYDGEALLPLGAWVEGAYHALAEAG